MSRLYYAKNAKKRLRERIFTFKHDKYREVKK